MMGTHIRGIVAGCLVGVFLLGACGGGTSAVQDAPEISTALPEVNGQLDVVDPATILGPIEITGSSTVFPLTAAIAEESLEAGSQASIDIKVTGTTDGFRVLCSSDHEVDIVNASRPMTDAERTACAEVDRTVVSFSVGKDALAVVVNASNDFVTELSLDQIAQIFSREVTTWAEVDPSYPNERIALYSPGTDSGTFDFLVEKVFDGDDEAIRNAPGILMSEDDFELVNGVADNPYAIGYFGFAYYQDNQDKLNAVAIDGGTGEAVAPSAETVSDDSYPLARPLFIYSSTEIVQEQPQVAAFIAYYLQTVSDVIEEVGYFPASSEELAQAQQTLLNATRRSAAN